MAKETHSDRLRPLYQSAKAGDMEAGRELIRHCRRGMLVPYWEDADREITDEEVETHLKRRGDPRR